MKSIYVWLLFLLFTNQAFAIKLFYNNRGELTIEELASHYREGNVDVDLKKFTGKVYEYDLSGKRVLELNYDKRGFKSGRFKYERFGAVIEGTFQDDVARFNLPDSIMKQIVDKERFVQARYIRKNDYKTIKSILSTIPQAQDSVVDNGEVYLIVEDPPVFPGDKSAISKFLTLHLVYPQQAKDRGVTGKVFIQFTIMADGTVDDVKVVRGIGFGCDEAAHFAVSKLPDWKPGYQRGKPVPVRMVIPLTFN